MHCRRLEAEATTKGKKQRYSRKEKRRSPVEAHGGSHNLSDKGKKIRSPKSAESAPPMGGGGGAVAGPRAARPRAMPARRR